MVRVLIVDDDKGLLGIIGEYLNAFNFKTDLAENAFRARQLLKNGAFDAVLSDYQMPGESGLDLLAHVSARYPGLPFIMMTGYKSPGLKLEVLKLGGIDCIEKPFELRDLVEILSNLPGIGDRESGTSSSNAAPPSLNGPACPPNKCADLSG